MQMIQSRWTPLLIGLILSLAAVVLGFVIGSDHFEGARLAARWTSRVGVPLFLTAYLASALWRLKNNLVTKTLVQRRRQWGLAFAWSHSVNLLLLTYFLVLARTPQAVITVIGGGLAYVLFYAMALTSNDWSQRKLGKNWQRLHRFGIHYIWFIYTFTYAGRLGDPGMRHVGIIGTGLFLLALVFRIFAWKWQKPSHKHKALVQ
jgi:DMSO/TMAO reductase YedYZ heme-binding membrane subunit